MVQAILAGRKTQTRRVMKHQPSQTGVDAFNAGEHPQMKCPYGQPGDVLWVRETFSAYGAFGVNGKVEYKADSKNGRSSCGLPWKPSIYMPKLAARIWLRITSVRVERLHDINRGDAIHEGCPFPNMADGPNPKTWFSDLWHSINGTDSWNANPWVWVLEFERIEKPIEK